MKTISKKVCLLGDFAVGKTSLIGRFVYKIFRDEYLSTIGVNISRKIVSVPHAGSSMTVTMILWDMADNGMLNQTRTNYLRGAAGVILVCDLTRTETLNSLRQFADQVVAINPDVQIIIAANKSDLPHQRQLTPAQLEDVAAMLNAPLYITSAKTGDEVELLFHHLGEQLASKL